MQLTFKFLTANNNNNNNNNKQRKMDLLNCSLPVRSITRIVTILETNDLHFAVPATDYDGSYNCWGYVAFNFEWEEEVRWLRGEEMECHLEENTTPISKEEATVGDIVVFRSYSGSLNHTALVTHELDVICHKPGSTPLCVDSMERAIGMYGNKISYVRPKSKKS